MARASCSARSWSPALATTPTTPASAHACRLNLKGVGGGDLPDPSTQVGERQYTYVTAARAAGLFEAGAFAKYQHTK
ncbi:hypothetical protein ACIQMV_33650 [Streptomyces sp. NPDC091412]|uniref:hypothetical protein n=1 Tax=Streptomyces sp. NPDC091412 TaxID=3366002 RepID=UPI003801BE2C